MRRRAALTAALLASLNLCSCYYHVMGGAAAATGAHPGPGGMVTASSGLNGLRGGFGLQATGLFFEQESSASLGVEGFRLWRNDTPLQPYVRGALGLLELGRSQDELLLGGVSPRAEAGLMWFGSGATAITLSAAAEYRFRVDELSTPIYWLQLGIGSFDFLDSTSKAARDSALPHR